MFGKMVRASFEAKVLSLLEHLAGPMLRVRVWVLQEDSHLALPAVGLWLGRKLGRMVRASVGAKVLSLV